MSRVDWTMVSVDTFASAGLPESPANGRGRADWIPWFAPVHSPVGRGDADLARRFALASLDVPDFKDRQSRRVDAHLGNRNLLTAESVSWILRSKRHRLSVLAQTCWTGESR